MLSIKDGKRTEKTEKGHGGADSVNEIQGPDPSVFSAAGGGAAGRPHGGSIEGIIACSQCHVFRFHRDVPPSKIAKLSESLTASTLADSRSS
jgi:hypothetical protein